MGTASTVFSTVFLRSATDAFTEPFSSLTAAAVLGKSVRNDSCGGSHGFGASGFGASSFWTRWVRSWLENEGARPLGRLAMLGAFCAVALARGSAPSMAADLPLGRGAGARELLPESSKNARHLLRAYILISMSQGRREGPLKTSSHPGDASVLLYLARKYKAGPKSKFLAGNSNNGRRHGLYHLRP